MDPLLQAIIMGAATGAGSTYVGHKILAWRVKALEKWQEKTDTKIAVIQQDVAGLQATNR